MNRHTRHIGWLVNGCTMLFAPLAIAWSDHATLAWPLLRIMPETTVQESVLVETLPEFLAAESESVAALLAQHELWAQSALPHYARLPQQLVFDASLNNVALERSFLEAIRVNPKRSYRPYVQHIEGSMALSPEGVISVSELTFLQGTIESSRTTYVGLSSGDRVDPAVVLATASDEPDFGMDIGLFSDNGTDLGLRYGFGPQPFGNPNLEYGSQAPFHMGFYHLDWLTQKVQPGLLATYPLYRTELYRKLAILAFQSGHDYWGWRFMGWGLHYVGDLAQPYHAVPLPGVGLLGSLLTVIRGEVEQAIQLVSNRHVVLESFQYQVVRSAVAEQDWDQSTLAEIATLHEGGEWQEDTVVNRLTASSAEAADDLDAALETHAPALLVADPNFEFSGSPQEADILKVIEAHSEDATAGLTTAVDAQMARFSRFAQEWIRSILIAGETPDS